MSFPPRRFLAGFTSSHSFCRRFFWHGQGSLQKERGQVAKAAPLMVGAIKQSRVRPVRKRDRDAFRAKGGGGLTLRNSIKSHLERAATKRQRPGSQIRLLDSSGNPLSGVARFGSSTWPVARDLGLR